MVTVTPIPPYWPGGTVFCVAPGPSLTAEDLDQIRGRPTIAINDAYRAAPWADVLYSSDIRWWKLRQGAPEFAGLRYGLVANPNRRAPRSEYEAFPEVRLLWNAGPEGLSTTPDALAHGYNSGYAAINFAILAGARRVILVGYTLGNGPGGRGYFHGGRTDPHRYGLWIRTYATLAPQVTAVGVTVINATTPSALTAFPRAALADVLAADAALA